MQERSLPCKETIVFDLAVLLGVLRVSFLMRTATCHPFEGSLAVDEGYRRISALWPLENSKLLISTSLCKQLSLFFFTPDQALPNYSVR